MLEHEITNFHPHHSIFLPLATIRNIDKNTVTEVGKRITTDSFIDISFEIRLESVPFKVILTHIHCYNEIILGSTFRTQLS